MLPRLDHEGLDFLLDHVIYLLIVAPTEEISIRIYIYRLRKFDFRLFKTSLDIFL
jgi:hypothetical protein